VEGVGAPDGEEVGVGAGGEEIAGEEAGAGVAAGGGVAVGGVAVGGVAGGGVAAAGGGVFGDGVVVGGDVGAPLGACAKQEVAKRPKMRKTCSAAEEAILGWREI
jgi:hypothetical protein